jgi:zinc/manganese transport system permease protein
MEAIHFLAAPFVMCLLLAGMHCYLGLHVLARGVVFVDLSLAQVAVFGATLALLIDPDHSSQTGILISLSCTFLAAALFTLAKKVEKKVSQEALIGVTYAFASAAIVIVVDQLAHGTEHLKEALVGQILWVSWNDVMKTFLIYSFVGIIHWIYRKQFLVSSFQNKNHPLFWDFLFYALFGIVITTSTPVAGVLLVFSYLIVPAVLSSLYFKTLTSKLYFGWLVSSFLSLFGMWVSYKWDLPVGAVLVVLLTSMPIVCVVGFFFKKN